MTYLNKKYTYQQKNVNKSLMIYDYYSRRYTKIEYQKITNLLGNASDTKTMSKFNTNKSVAVNDHVVYIIRINK